MNPDLAERLRRAQEAAPKLAAATDELNGNIRDIEAALVGLNLGVHVAVALESTPHTELAFGRYGGTWGLYIVRESIPGEPEHQRLIGASRDDRIVAANRLPNLVEGMVALVERYSVEIGEASAKVASLAGSLVARPSAAEPTEEEIQEMYAPGSTKTRAPLTQLERLRELERERVSASTVSEEAALEVADRGGVSAETFFVGDAHRVPVEPPRRRTVVHKRTR